MEFTEINTIEKFEHQILRWIVRVGLMVSCGLLILDTFVFHDQTSQIAEIFGIVFLSIYFWLSRKPVKEPWISLLFILIFIGIINIHFLHSYGLLFPNTVNYFIIFIGLIIMVPGKYRNYLVILLFTDILFFIFYQIQVYSPRDAYNQVTSHEIARLIHVLLFFILGGFVVVFLKSRYEKLSTEMNNAIRETQQINEELEKMVNRRTGQLTTLNQELNLHFYSGTFDFRPQICTLKGLAELSRMSQLDESEHQVFDLVKQTTEAFEKLVNKYQMLYWINHPFLEEKETGMLYTITGLIDRFTDDRHRIHLDYRINYPDKNRIPVKIIEIILHNLVENAIQFSKQESSGIKLSVYDSQDHLFLHCRDQGEGIKKEYQNRVFDMYFRGSYRSKGNGLGLYVVRKAVEKSHGEIQINSEYGRFTEIRIHIPLDPEKRSSKMEVL